MWNTENDRWRNSRRAILPPPLRFSPCTTPRFRSRRSAKFFCRLPFCYVLFLPSVCHIECCRNIQPFSSVRYQRTHKLVNYFVCPSTTLFTLAPAPLSLLSLDIFVNVHALKLHALVFLITVTRSLWTPTSSQCPPKSAVPVTSFPHFDIVLYNWN